MHRFRVTRIAGTIIGLWLLLAGAIAPRPASAEPPVTMIPQGPLPVGDLAPVEFSYMTLDVAIAPTDSGVAIETRTRTRLRNPDKKQSFDRQVTFAAPPVYNVKTGTQNGGLYPNNGTDPWQLSLGPDGDAVIEGVQAASASGPLVDLGFDWGALAPWGWPLGAARLTLNFQGGVDSEQLLVVDPEPTERDPLRLSWSYEKLQPKGKVRVFFIAPGYWRPLRKARQAVADPQATAADYLALAAALRPLVAADGMPADLAGALRAEQLAALHQAVALAPQDARTHDQLGVGLWERSGGAPALLAQAVAELKAAYDLTPGDANVKQHLLQALEDLMAACRKAGDTRGLLGALDVAEAMGATSSPERAGAYADLIVGLLDQGRLPEAEATVVAGFGQGALDRYAYYRPHFSAVTGEVDTNITQRTARFTLVPSPGMEPAAARDVDSLVQALSQAGTAQVVRTDVDGKSVVEVAIPFDGPEALRAAGLALAGMLPPDSDPALLLVGAALGPKEVQYRASRLLQSDRLTYAESADLSPAQSALSDREERARADIAEAQAPSDDPLEAARRRWELALLRAYQAGWHDLSTGCQITYRVLPPEDLVAPQWALAWGEQRSMAWSTSIPRPQRLAPIGIGLGVALVLGLAGLAVWRWRKRESGDLPVQY